MKINITKDDGTTKDLDIKLKGRHIKEVWKKMMDTTKGTQEEQADKIMDLGDYLDELAAELSGMSIDELNELDIEEKEKITVYIKNKSVAQMDFMKP